MGARLRKFTELKRIGALGKKMIVCVAPGVVRTLDVAIATVGAFPFLVLDDERDVMRVNSPDRDVTALRLITSVNKLLKNSFKAIRDQR